MIVGYFLLQHGRISLPRTRPGAKEASVGLLFAFGVSLPLLVVAPARAEVWLTMALFAGLCALNCWCITRWETPDPVGSPVFLGGSAFMLLVAAATATPVVMALLVGILALLTLDQCRLHLSPNALRVLADVSLLSPLAMEAVR
jgi:hypothetical protein